MERWDVVGRENLMVQDGLWMWIFRKAQMRRYVFLTEEKCIQNPEAIVFPLQINRRLATGICRNDIFALQASFMLVMHGCLQLI